MNQVNILSDAISDVADEFSFEAYEYIPSGFRKNVKKIGGLVACLCIVVVGGMWIHFQREEPVNVYAYAYGISKPLKDTQATLLTGKINDDGEMEGAPVRFYVSGEGIESIRYSCKNQWIECIDGTEKRGDYGMSKNFTVKYGKKEQEYSYILINWVPKNTIKELTEGKNRKISELSRENKQDIIVMEVKYRNGKSKTMAIEILLKDNGHFFATICEYTITSEDTFTKGTDTKPMKKENKETVKEWNEQVWEQEQKEKENSDDTSSEELQKVKKFVLDYYTSLNRSVTDIRLTNNPTTIDTLYSGYTKKQVLIFEVSEKNGEAKRYIAVGSKDGWKHYKVLNEGY